MFCSSCGFMMGNLYEYDGLHRITAMNNVFFGPTPYPDAFSTTYSYDKAGNIQQPPAGAQADSNLLILKTMSLVAPSRGAYGPKLRVQPAVDNP